jgi:hypothetical protein
VKLRATNADKLGARDAKNFTGGFLNIGNRGGGTHGAFLRHHQPAFGVRVGLLRRFGVL